ncbi:hypothetical protein Tco_0426212 [Tanacetum coccineum]
MFSNTPNYIYPIIVPSNFDIEDVFSSTNTPDYTPASPDYSSASPGNTSSDPSEDLSKDLLALLAISPFYDDPYMKVMQAYDATNNESPIPPPRDLIAPSTILPPSPVFEIGESSYKTHLERHEEQIETIFNHLDELPLERIEHMEDNIEDIMDIINDQDIEHTISPTLPLDYSLMSYLSGHTQAATMANTDNANRNTRQGETPIARKCSYKEFMSCQPFNFKGTEGAVSLIRWFERTESVFSRSNCTEECKVKFATGTLTEEALS